MYGNNSLMADKDITFFGEQGFTIKDSLISQKDCTKNSSNPEKVYKELNQEISKIRDARNSDLNSSNSRNNDVTFNDQLIDPKIWSNNNETQDSNQYFKKYESLKKKEKGTPMNKVKKPNIQFIPNNNYDYSADTDEFGMGNVPPEDDELTGKVNKISSIQMKNNNINQIDKNSLHYLSTKMNHLWIGPTKNRIHQNCFTEPDDFYVNRREYSGSFHNNMNTVSQFNMSSMTPQKQRQDGLSINALYGNNLNSQINFPNKNYESLGSSNNSNMIPNFPRIINSGSIISNISTQYSSNNKKKREFFNHDEDDNERSIEFIDGNSLNEEHYINTYNLNYRPKSDRKATRLPTSESNESNNSAHLQYNYLKNYPQMIGINLNSQFSSGGNFPVYIDEEARKNFSSSFNENNYLMHPNNFESAFSLNTCSNNSNNSNSNTNLQLESGCLSTPRQKINKHTKSENIYSNVKLGNEKNLLILEDILLGRDKRTTVMIRNIPIKYSDEMILKELEEFKGKFDCLYLPYDYEKNGNRGYAFINFVHPFHILLFHQKFEGKSWSQFESKKICELNSAKFQGINEIKKHASRYKGLKKPSFFPTSDVISNLEVPMKYYNQLKFYYPKAILEEGIYGGIIIKSFGK